MPTDFGQRSKQWIRDLGKFDFAGRHVHRKAASLHNKLSRERFKQHRDPTGRPWAPRAPVVVNVGDVVPIGIDRRHGSAMFGEFYVREIRNMEEALMVAARRNRISRSGPPLFRPRSRNDKAVMLQKAMTMPSSPNHIQKVTDDGMEVGAMGRSTAHAHEHGQGPIPQRSMAGYTDQDLDQILEMYADEYVKQVLK